MTPIKSIAVVGGGSAGWMSAAFLSAMLGPGTAITLVESDEIGTVGVGEATIPPIRQFNAMIGLDEGAFLAATQGTYKLGIEFRDWGRVGDSYMHAFGAIGQGAGTLSCHQHWLADRGRPGAPSLEALTLGAGLARAGRFSPPQKDRPRSPLSRLAHAYHFDAGLYAAFLRSHAEARGVTRIEGRIVEVRQEPARGHIQSLRLADGREVAADFYIDCSGFRGLLIEQTLKAGWDSARRWLPCDRALAAPTLTPGPITPYTRATAVDAGWRWRIPLRHRTGNGLVYSSDHLSDDKAHERLIQGLDGELLADPRPIRFEPGRRKAGWIGNCLAVGLAGGFLEPLESTSLHMVQTALYRFLTLYPDAGCDPARIAEYNRLSAREFEQVRDFVILHYVLNARDEPFWRQVRETPPPDGLARKLELFAAFGHIERESDELFYEESWVQVLLGQGASPAAAHPLAALKSPAERAAFLDQIAAVNAACVEACDTHDAYLAAVLARAGAASTRPLISTTTE
ncbi:tryptophan 7-halogenase [Caulobacter sp. 602-2]|uniref:Tryptophan 7-halogenase n=1 Tax=Caulobacter sp. 602-2 TaxID=2710887 RepID=A0A6G4R0F4_9CAUL|nr:tryptophan 7-halogenase [Caulobacter sp. 602-2]